MRIKFSVMNLILLTIIAAMVAQMVRSHFHANEQQALIEHYRAIHAQALVVRQRQKELRAKVLNQLPEIRSSYLYNHFGLGPSLALNPLPVDQLVDAVAKVQPPSVGKGQTASELRTAEMRVLRANLELQQLEFELTEQLGEDRVVVP